MDKLVIEGGKPLYGDIEISGSKNATLPLLAAMLLAPGKYRLNNVPELNDVGTMSHLLRILGAQIQRNEHTLTVDTTRAEFTEAPYELVKTMRASFYVLGPLVARHGHARVSLPGGCAWGPRPVDLHLKALEALGANITLEEGYVVAEAKKLKGATFEFAISSVGASGNTIMAAVLAEGTTVLKNVAIEPEITHLAKYLLRMGADIEGIGTKELVIRGVKDLHPIDADVIPDRIETGTYLCAVGMAGGDVQLKNTEPKHVEAALLVAEQMGVQTQVNGSSIRVTRRNGKLKAMNVTTDIFPGFPTDLQAPFMAMACLADGPSRIIDTIYKDRFTHVAELTRLGAKIDMHDNEAVIHGISHFSGAQVMSTDLRASVCLVLAGLAATGTTEVKRIYHLDRGYEKIEKKLANVGASVRREQGEM